jgi:predicted MFS family arabinose efflux permease
MLHLQPLIVLCGINIAVYGSILISLMTRSMEEVSDTKALLAMAFFGLGEIIGGLGIGRMRDCVSNRAAVIF